jgi:two-component system, response regulator
MDEQVDILLIEDNPHEAELAIRSLKKHHLANRLIHIDDGEEALDFLFCRGKYAENTRKSGPKLILLDLKLPKVSGHEILQQIRQVEQLRTIPIVVLTSSSEEGDLLRSYELGVNSYIVKPVNFEAFSKAIEEVGMYWMVLNKIPSS